MTDREERQHVIEVLQKMVDWMQEIDDIATPERIHALFYAIASIKTDLKYDLLYEQESNCSEIPTGSTTKDYLGVDAISRQAINGYIDYILSHGMGKKKSFDFIKKFVANLPPTTSQEPCKDCISRQALIDWLKNWTLGDATPLIDFVNSMPAVTLQLSSELEKNSKKLEKDFGESDCISREQAKTAIRDKFKDLPSRVEINTILNELPSVTPQEPKTGHCKDCKYFELNSWAACGGIPIIVAHEICKAWGNGCKTKEDGYCFLFEPQESEG